jgi:hypothetical protein
MSYADRRFLYDRLAKDCTAHSAAFCQLAREQLLDVESRKLPPLVVEQNIEVAALPVAVADLLVD